MSLLYTLHCDTRKRVGAGIPEYGQGMDTLNDRVCDNTASLQTIADAYNAATQAP